MLRTVLFAPEDLALVKGDPTERRRFLDDLLVARAPRLAGVRADYDRVLKQRNALLKSARRRRAGRRGGDLRTLDVWDAHLAAAGAELLAARLDLVDALRPLVDKAYDAVGRRGAGRRPARWTTRARWAPEAPLRRRPRAARRRAARRAGARAQHELERGIRLVGPHRDDLVLGARADLPAKGYASHGESWSFALALRWPPTMLRARRRRAGADPRRRVRRARRRRRDRLAGWSPAPSRCWSPPPWPRTCPRRSPEPGWTSWADRYGRWRERPEEPPIRVGG